MANYQRLKGMMDILPGEIELWQKLEIRARHFFSAYGFGEIRTPVLEPLELFTRSIGEASEIVHKQMYAFTDRGERMITLRPEMTAAVVRAAVEGGLLRAGGKTLRLYYQGPMFRAERPQKGRLRQFHQIGCELFNAKAVEGDVEAVSVAHDLLRWLGLKDFVINVNYLGDESDRENYRKVLRDYFAAHKTKLNEEELFRLEKNVLRLLDSKNPDLQDMIAVAPRMLLSDASRENYAAICSRLQARGISFVQNTRLVRGLDYYTGLVFEVTGASNLGAQDAVAAGGRYDRLVQECGGPQTSATGFAMGVERLLLALGQSGDFDPQTVYVALAAEAGNENAAAREYFAKIIRILSEMGKCPKSDPGVKNLRDHLEKALKSGCRFVMIIGDEEIKANTVTIKDLQSKKQETISWEQWPAFLLKEALC